MKALVAMSGGVDSSVAAALMLDQGYDVIGVTLKQWEGPDGTMPVAGVLHAVRCRGCSEGCCTARHPLLRP